MQPIVFPDVPFDHELVTDLIQVERVRVDFRTEHSLDPLTLELRGLFQHLTSMMSARIEGNRTTVAEAIQGTRAARAAGQRADDAIQEILQLEDATDHIDKLAREGRLRLNHQLVRDLHHLAVADLQREGDRTPGAYRSIPVAISGAEHQPPGPEAVQADMDQLLDFAQCEVPPQQQLLQIALVHHRFAWIHPFSNGNGRVSRLLTYAMLVNQGYTSSASARPVNPTAVFGADRQSYYEHLARADSLEPDDLFAWCAYVIHGLRADLSTVVQLADLAFVVDGIIVPALRAAVSAAVITSEEADIIEYAARRGTCRAGDFSEVIPGSSSTRSQRLRRLVSTGYLQILSNPRRYAVDLRRSPITIHVVHRLDELGMLPAILRDHD